MFIWNSVVRLAPTSIVLHNGNTPVPSQKGCGRITASLQLDIGLDIREFKALMKNIGGCAVIRIYCGDKTDTQALIPLEEKSVVFWPA
ncbi:hypothetical protein QE152_g36548 [Popillia japonica]|uniref:Uncharacterized protein n=1 Tax=Popillia japonica TaxID=7064 RepID=A0AAW1ICY0_POPJA